MGSDWELPSLCPQSWSMSPPYCIILSSPARPLVVSQTFVPCPFKHDSTRAPTCPRVPSSSVLLGPLAASPPSLLPSSGLPNTSTLLLLPSPLILLDPSTCQPLSLSFPFSHLSQALGSGAAVDSVSVRAFSKFPSLEGNMIKGQRLCAHVQVSMSLHLYLMETK